MKYQERQDRKTIEKEKIGENIKKMRKDDDQYYFFVSAFWEKIMYDFVSIFDAITFCYEHYLLFYSASLTAGLKL